MDAMKCKDFSYWSSIVTSSPEWEQAQQKEVEPLPAPLHILCREAISVAKFFSNHWQDQKTPKGILPGLIRALNEKQKQENEETTVHLHQKLGEEILSLKRAVDEAQTQYSLTCEARGSTGSSIVGRARFLLAEIVATVEWYFDDGVEDEKDEKLRRIKASHAKIGNSAAALARKLYDYGSLANQYRKALAAMSEFDVEYIDEALGLVEQLQSLPSSGEPVGSPEQREALRLRNALVRLLMARVNTIRAAARFIYRGRPQVVRQVTSAHQRNKRQAARRKEKAAEESAPISIQ